MGRVVSKAGYFREYSLAQNLRGEQLGILYSVIESSDGNYVVGGISNSSDGDVSHLYGAADFWLVKVDTSGNLLWEKTFGGTSQDEAYKIIETRDSNLIIYGHTDSHDFAAINSNSASGGSNILLVKTDQDGNILWSNCYGDIGNATSKSLVEDSNGTLHLAGSVSSATGDAAGCNIHGCCDAWMLTIDSSGNIITSQCFGSNSVDDGRRVIIPSLSPGHYYFLGSGGSNSGDVTGYHGGDDIWVVKFVDSTALINNVSSVEKNELDIFPNPFTDQITISNFKSDLSDYTINDFLGKEYQCSFVSKGTNTIINTSHLKTGVYLIRLVYKNELVTKILFKI